MTEENQENTGLASEIANQHRSWNQIFTSNKAESDSLMQLGAALDPGFVNRIRLDSFITFVFGRMGGLSDHERELITLQFETEYERKISSCLKDAKSEVRKAMLSQGGNIPESQLRKMWNDQQNGNGGLIH